ncbi:hypothetical protein ONZ51_g8612 [Trametes cubensis]|uniref:Fungal-type protein kinase domain-containing protein n=1 Tax=Trametes cubensis TaxID=1111947 RepID=A0AAD7TPW4_9APHY|nr:hypothetical protein ONZ51_g8612 [Trametes cubensis]
MSQSLLDPDFLVFVTDESQASTNSLDDFILATLEDATPSVGMYNVPLTLIENSSEVFGHSPKDSRTRCPADVLNEMPLPTNAFETIPRAGNAESDIYEPLIMALNDAGTDGSSPRCPGFTFLDTSEHPDTGGNYALKPDVLCYASEHVPRVRVNDSHSRADMGFASFFIEIKREPLQDFFQDPPAHWGSSRGAQLLKLGDAKWDTLQYFGQNIAYAAELCVRQYRHCCFSISVSGCWARLMRWDRSGLVVTRTFDLHHEPEILCEFLWRYAHMSEAERGMDLSVEVASEAEETKFRDSIREHVALQLELHDRRLEPAVLEHYQPKAVSAICIPDAETHEPRRYLVSRPLTAPLSIVGRASRTYWAVDAETGRVVSLKDSWRVLTDRAEQEGTVVDALTRSGVANVPNVLSHGDVFSISDDHNSRQLTRTQEFVAAHWACDLGVDQSSILRYSHYRLVLSIAGCLWHIAAMCDASSSKRLHRNVHPASIILFREKADVDRRAFLVDWDLSGGMDGSNQRTRPPHDAMWQFVSIGVLLRYPRPHRIQDDMESLLYVMLYCALRWLGHSMDPEQLLISLIEMFDYSSRYSRKIQGGDHKVMNAIQRKYTKDVQFTNRALHKWLNKLMDQHHPIQTQMAEGSFGYNESSSGKLWSNPEKLAARWRRFLDKESLGRNDRVVRTIVHEVRDIQENASPHPATVPSHEQRVSKRLAEVLEEDEDFSASDNSSERKTKRRKLEPPTSGAASSTADENHLGSRTWEPLRKLTIPRNNDKQKRESSEGTGGSDHEDVT